MQQRITYIKKLKETFTGGLTMTDRDRLTEMIKQANTLYLDYLESIDQKGLIDTEGRAEYIADYLIANGIIVLPCKVGDKVYIVKSRTSDDKNLYIIEDVVKRIIFDKSEDTGFIHSRIEFFNTSSISDWLFQNIFLTREEAEKALENYRENT